MNKRRLLRNGVTLIESVEMAVRLRERLRGLLGRYHLPDGHAMFLGPCAAVHTFFMRFPLDLIFVDREMVVLKIALNIQPFRFVFGGWRAAGVIEARSGSLNLTGLQLGDRLEWGECGGAGTIPRIPG